MLTLLANLILVASARRAQGAGLRLAVLTTRRFLATLAMPFAASAASGAQPEWLALRVTQAPVIDGSLTDDVWARANPLTEFLQADSFAGGAASEATEVRIVYDDRALYVALRAFDRNPGGLRATVVQRDADQRSDDSFTIVLDTFGTARGGYLFQVNPLGGQRDGLISPGTGRDGIEWEWDGIWRANSRRDDRGWTAELAIPFASLSFAPDRASWGFNLQRVIKRKEETVRWTAVALNQQIGSIADAGRLTGLTRLRTGLGLDVRPHATLRTTRDRARNDTSTQFKPGLDLFYKVTPSITAALTVNTDFAETDVDDLTINLTRFPIFFPEKRAFFLQDTSIFNFGGITRTPRPFFSRRIGLAPDRTPLDLLAGLKLTGRHGPLSFGVLDVQMAESDTLPSLNLGVARASLNLFDESSIGLIATHGDPQADRSHWLVGGDFNYRNSNWRGTQEVLAGRLWVQRSHMPGITASPWAFGGELDYPNDRWGGRVAAHQIDPGFDAPLGFVEQLGVRNYAGEIRHTLRLAGWDRIDLNAKADITTDLAGTVDHSLITVPDIFFSFGSRDALSLKQFFHRENLREPFRLVPGVTIPPGDYRFTRHEVWFRGGTARVLSGRVLFSTGDFYGGRRNDYAFEPEWRPNSRFTLNARFNYNDIKLPQGEVVIRSVQMRATVAFTTKIVWNAVLQYDNQSSALGLNTRLRWTVEPGRDLYLVFSQGYVANSDFIRPTYSDASMKAAWTWRF